MHAYLLCANVLGGPKKELEGFCTEGRWPFFEEHLNFDLRIPRLATRKFWRFLACEPLTKGLVDRKKFGIWTAISLGNLLSFVAFCS